MAIGVGQQTRAGVGFSDRASSRDAGVEAAQKALAHGSLETCDLVLMFATSRHDPVAFGEGVRSVVGLEAHVFGGSAVGVITNDRLGYEGFEAAVATIETGDIQAELFIEGGLPDREREVGAALAGQISARGYSEPPITYVLYDIVKHGMPGEGLDLNLAAPLIDGMAEVFDDWPPLVGGGLLGDMRWHASFQWFEDRLESQSAIALALTGGLRMDTIIMHGCTPSTTYKTITKADRNVVLEFDGRPAVDAVADVFGDDLSWQEYPVYITLGINHGEKFGEVREENYAVRLCMDIDRERGGLVMFGDDMQAGTEVQLMRRTLDLDYVRGRTGQLVERLGDRTPVLATYIDCSGRMAMVCGTDFEEARGVQEAIGEIPLLGWYVGCELAKAGPTMQSHNWTGVLSILSR